MGQEKDQDKGYQKFLKAKIERARESLKSGHGQSNERVENEFAQRRSDSQREADR